MRLDLLGRKGTVLFHCDSLFVMPVLTLATPFGDVLVMSSG